MTRTYIVTMEVTDKYGEIVERRHPIAIEEVTATLQEIIDDGSFCDGGKPNITVKVLSVEEDTTGYEEVSP